jgi:hypothetical protein
MEGVAVDGARRGSRSDHEAGWAAGGGGDGGNGWAGERVCDSRWALRVRQSERFTASSRHVRAWAGVRSAFRPISALPFLCCARARRARRARVFTTSIRPGDGDERDTARSDDQRRPVHDQPRVRDGSRWPSPKAEARATRMWLDHMSSSCPAPTRRSSSPPTSTHSSVIRPPRLCPFAALIDLLPSPRQADARTECLLVRGTEPAPSSETEEVRCQQTACLPWRRPWPGRRTRSIPAQPVYQPPPCGRDQTLPGPRVSGRSSFGVQRRAPGFSLHAVHPLVRRGPPLVRRVLASDPRPAPIALAAQGRQGDRDGQGSVPQAGGQQRVQEGRRCGV